MFFLFLLNMTLSFINLHNIYKRIFTLIYRRHLVKISWNIQTMPKTHHLSNQNPLWQFLRLFDYKSFMWWWEQNRSLFIYIVMKLYSVKNLIKSNFSLCKQLYKHLRFKIKGSTLVKFYKIDGHLRFTIKTHTILNKH